MYLLSLCFIIMIVIRKPDINTVSKDWLDVNYTEHHYEMSIFSWVFHWEIVDEMQYCNCDRKCLQMIYCLKHLSTMQHMIIKFR